jgi:hypothetical protein
VDSRGEDFALLSFLARAAVVLAVLGLIAAVVYPWWRQYDDTQTRDVRRRHGVDSWSWSGRLEWERGRMGQYYTEHPECTPVVGGWRFDQADRSAGHATGHCY